MTEKSSLSYADCGVDIDAGNAFVGRIKQAVASTVRPEVLAGLGGFGGMFQPDFSAMQEPVLVSGTDGVGTKLLLLQQYDRPQVAGMDAVAMCVNDIAALAAEPLFFLDYLATGKLSGETLAGVVEGIAEACRICECALIGGETAEMPGMYAPGHYDIGGFAVGVVDKGASSMVPALPKVTWFSAWPPAGRMPTATPWCASCLSWARRICTMIHCPTGVGP